MSGFKIPKPEQIRLSPEAQRGLSDFRRAAQESGERVGARAAQAMREFAASLERMRAIRNPPRLRTHESPQTEV